MTTALTLEISVAAIPEAMAELRQALASLLRQAAEDEPPEVAARLRRLAAAFESGLDTVE